MKMMSESDVKIVEKILGMEAEELSSLMSNLDSGALDYLETILKMYDSSLG